MEALVQAVANPHRRQILRLVWDDELSSGQIASHFDITWPSISRNLKVLREAGLVRERRVGNQRLYQADRDALRPLEAILAEMWEEGLDRIARAVEAKPARWKAQRRERR